MDKKAILTICESGGVNLTFDPPTEKDEASFRSHLGMVALLAVTEECKRRGWLESDSSEEEYGNDDE